MWIWIIGTCEQVTHTINGFYVKQMVGDFPLKILRERAKFTPIIPLPFGNGKYMTILVR